MIAQTGQASFTLGPGARSSVGVTILPKRRPVISLWADETPFRIAVEMTGAADRPGGRVAVGSIVNKALIGPWQMAALASVVGVALLVIVLSSAAMLFALRGGETQAVAPVVAAPSAPPALAFAVVLSMEKPVPTREPGAELPTVEPSLASESTTGTLPAPAPVLDQNGLPVVQAGQVSAPGAPAALSLTTVEPPATRARLPSLWRPWTPAV